MYIFSSFGLPLCIPLLQRPIHHAASFLLDFLRAFLRFNVQSTTPLLPFWTSSVTFSTSTSNPPRRLTINHLQSHKCLHYNPALIISAALTIFLRLASVSGTPLVLSPQSGFTHNLSLSIFVSIIFIARVISSTDGILGE